MKKKNLTKLNLNLKIFKFQQIDSLVELLLLLNGFYLPNAKLRIIRDKNFFFVSKVYLIHIIK